MTAVSFWLTPYAAFSDTFKSVAMYNSFCVILNCERFSFFERFHKYNPVALSIITPAVNNTTTPAMTITITDVGDKVGISEGVIVDSIISDRVIDKALLAVDKTIIFRD